jgi:ATPase subunit of ABC transporter with duplicated ATPase domains
MILSQRRFTFHWFLFLLVVGTFLLPDDASAFVVERIQSPRLTTTITKNADIAFGATLLYAKKKHAAAAAALEKLAILEDELDANRELSKKEQKALLKQQQQQRQVHGSNPGSSTKDHNAATTANYDTPPSTNNNKQLNKKELALQKALEMEALDESHKQQQQDDDDNDDIVHGSSKKLSKKELKALQKKQQKSKPAVATKDDEALVNGDDAPSDTPVLAEQPPPQEEETGMMITLEDKIRKERPPPRIRILDAPQPGYVALRLENVGMIFRNQMVLSESTWGVQTGERVGLVGSNGAGKTTQIKIIAGDLVPTTGDLVKSKSDLRISVLRQEFVDELVPERTLREEFLSVFEIENQILQDLKQVERELADETITQDTQKMQELLDRYQDLQNIAEDKNVYALESRVQKTMDLMGFNPEEAEDLVASFSGGWKMRIGLGKVLLQEPNILCLDEPTNHLDLESVEWMEEFLRQQTIPLVIVSHDREFLDRVCTKIVETEGGMSTEYEGNYSRFLMLKKARMDSWQAAYEAQEKKIREEKAWIQQFKVKQPQAVKQRQAKLEKFLSSPDYVKKPPFVGKPFRFRFPDAPRLSPEVAAVRNLSHAYANDGKGIINRLFDDVNLEIVKGDRIAVVGPNGSGKSTLLRLLVGKETPISGFAGVVGQNVVVNYFEQNQADALDLDKTVLDTIQAASSGQSYNELRALLGQFLFKGDSVEKKVSQLSGGEKARLSLCCMMLRPANLLILDEPTNHLDIPAKEMLEEALQHFTGSVVIVSHDRFFLSRVANVIVAIEDKKLVKYAGDYKNYMDTKSDIKEKIEARYIPGVRRIEAAPILADVEAVVEAAAKKKNFGGAKTANLVTRKNKGVKNAKRMEAK